jgi:hypothetical protein
VNQELTKEVRFLKQQQRNNGKELIAADKEDSYPQKIKQLIEELRISKEQQ